MKIINIIGSRPQFIKAAPLSKAFRESKKITEITIHTGQHYDSNMSDIFFKQMKIPSPKFKLNINNLSHGEMTGKMLIETEKILLSEKPDMVLVYGDTNSTLAGALAASKLNIRIAHVEAGLRSFNNKIPEEINRILTDRISSILFCPTNTAVENLQKEGFKNYDCEIHNVGDIMYESALLFSESQHESTQKQKKPYALATVHRQENTNDIARLKSIIDALNNIHKKTIHVIMPIHPRTKNILTKNNINIQFSTIEPVGYIDMIQLIKSSNLIITDSGGLQKEAFFFNKYCITLRDETEWTELVTHKYNYPVGANTNLIFETSKFCLNQKFSKKHNFYGEGNTSEQIINKLSNL